MTSSKKSFNPRIEELSQKAIEMVNEEFGPIPPVDWIKAYNQFFAELIIQECATIADRNSPMSWSDHGIKIKRHFGVER